MWNEKGNIFCTNVLTKIDFVCKLRLGNTGGRFLKMKPIDQQQVQEKLDTFTNKPVYIHLETTNGAYASHFENKGVNVGAYIRNAQVTFTNAVIKGDIGYRVGLKTELGWIYAEGLTDAEIYRGEDLLLAGHDLEGRLMVALQISEQPFK